MSRSQAPPNNAERIALLDRLIELTRRFAADLDGGKNPDIAGFNRTHREVHRAIETAGPIRVDVPDVGEVETRLQALDELNDALAVAIEDLTADARERLGTLRSRRRGLAGYRDALIAQRGPGARLGKG